MPGSRRHTTLHLTPQAPSPAAEEVVCIAGVRNPFRSTQFWPYSGTSRIRVQTRGRTGCRCGAVRCESARRRFEPASAIRCTAWTDADKSSPDRSHDETVELAAKVFELSQTLRQKWLTADYDPKRRIFGIVCLNYTLNGATLVPTLRKPFDVLAEVLISENSRGNWTAIELFSAGLASWEAAVRGLVGRRADSVVS